MGGHNTRPKRGLAKPTKNQNNKYQLSKEGLLKPIVIALLCGMLHQASTPAQLNNQVARPIDTTGVQMANVSYAPVKPIPQLTNTTEQELPQIQQPVIAPPETHALWMGQAGISPSDFSYVDYIVSHESGWCYLRWQGQPDCPTSFSQYGSFSDGWEGYGLCQSTPGGKMAAGGDDFATNPITQLKWCNAYALSAYGSWSAAYEHWTAYHNW